MRSKEVGMVAEPVQQHEPISSRRSTRFRIMRHGQSEANKPGQLHINNPSLSDLGKIQATVAGTIYRNASLLASEMDKDFLEPLQRQGLSYTRIFHAGNKIRAQQTAERILAVLPVTIPVHTDIRLTEQLEGYSPAYVGDQTQNLKRRFDEKVYGMRDAERWVYDGSDVEGLDLGHYETREEAAQRYTDALVDIATKYEGEDILIIGHAFIMRAFLASLKRQAKEQIKVTGESDRYPDLISESDFDGFDFDNTGHVDLEFYRDKKGKMKMRMTDLQLQAAA